MFVHIVIKRNKSFFGLKKGEINFLTSNNKIKKKRETFIQININTQHLFKKGVMAYLIKAFDNGISIKIQNLQFTSDNRK